MLSKFIIPFLLVSANCFAISDPFLDKEAHIPPSAESAHIIEFCTTRSLDNGALKDSLMKQFKTAFNIESFVETGTYLGDTTILASQIFDKVHTVELSPELFAKASNRFAEIQNISLYCGDSGETLKKLIPGTTGRVFFYLDGHYSGHITAKGSLDTPLLKELQSIKEANKPDSVILIDDIRLFQTSRFPEKICSLKLGLETYPELETVVAAILNINPNYQFCFLGDTLLAFPIDENVSISPVMRSCALHRLENLFVNLSENELIEADQIIGQAHTNEKSEIEIYFQTYSPFEIEYGYRCYACFWNGLILRENDNENLARFYFHHAANNSMQDWRVNEYLN